ncbi:MAG: alanine racemase [Blastocatellia bacterium]
MTRFISQGKTALRPHFKNHQSVWLSAKQLDAGAIGITCATVEQAETLVQHGIRSILIASEIVGAAKLGRLAELARQADVLVAVDNARVVAEMARIARNKKTQFSVLVDVNVGLNRCGVSPGEAALSLAMAAAEQGLIVRGVMGYEGRVQLNPPDTEKEIACRSALQLAVDTRNLIERHRIPCEIVSAGCTATYSVSARYPGVTEIQAGTYLTMDTSYLGFAPDFEPTLSVLATIVSKTAGHRVVVDAGRRALSGEKGLPAVRNLAGVRLKALHSEHATIEVQDPAVPVEERSRFRLIDRFDGQAAQVRLQLHPPV